EKPAIFDCKKCMKQTMLTNAQKTAYHQVHTLIDKEKNKVIVIDAPSGSGKTFLLSTLASAYGESIQYAVFRKDQSSELILREVNAFTYVSYNMRNFQLQYCEAVNIFRIAGLNNIDVLYNLISCTKKFVHIDHAIKVIILDTYTITSPLMLLLLFILSLRKNITLIFAGNRMQLAAVSKSQLHNRSNSDILDILGDSTVDTLIKNVRSTDTDFLKKVSHFRKAIDNYRSEGNIPFHFNIRYELYRLFRSKYNPNLQERLDTVYIAQFHQVLTERLRHIMDILGPKNYHVEPFLNIPCEYVKGDKFFPGLLLVIDYMEHEENDQKYYYYYPPDDQDRKIILNYVVTRQADDYMQSLLKGINWITANSIAEFENLKNTRYLRIPRSIYENSKKVKDKTTPSPLMEVTKFVKDNPNLIRDIIRKLPNEHLMTAREVTLVGGSPWGFRMHGGHDLHQPLRISRVNPGSKAAQQGVREGDLISSINGRSTRDLTNSEAHALLRNSGEHLKLGLNHLHDLLSIVTNDLSQNVFFRFTETTTIKNTSTSNTRIITTESKKNETNDAKSGHSYVNQNGGPKSSSIEQRDETKTTGYGNETDLLHEIDSALKVGRGFLFGKENVMFAPTFKASSATPGVWSPGSEPPPPPKEPSPDQRESEKNAGIPPVWTPSSATASPVPEKKEFRPVQFESPILSRKKLPQQEVTHEAPPPWEAEGKKHTIETSYDSSSRIVNSHSAPSQGLNSLASTTRLPRAQNPTITLLQKAREGQLPKGTAYLEENETVKRPPSDERPLISPGEIIYTVKKEYESEPETESEPPKKMADLGPRKFEGIGPTTKEGIPLVLRSEVKENNQTKWYKKMYDSLHRAEKNDDYVTIRYKPRRGTRYGYGSGYLSEPEHRLYSERSATIDSHRRLRNKENDFSTSTMPRKNGTLKFSSDVYKNQPGRIEDYEPGRSSIAEKEAKEWWDEVMDIFDGWLHDNGHPQGTGLEDLRNGQLSYRGLSDNVRVSAVSSSKALEVVPRSCPTLEESFHVGIHHAKPRTKQWSSNSVLDRSRLINLERKNETVKDDPWKDRIQRPLDRAADCVWHAGMLEGRSKSFVLPDRCLHRSNSPIHERSVILQATSDEHHRHPHHHHLYHHYHHHRVSPTSSSSTSSSISSNNHIMIPSPLTAKPSLLTGNISRPFDQRDNRPAKPYMTHALKESGYESDSTLVFRRKEDISPLSQLEQRLAYKTVQSGGDVPLHGFRKPAPERPKGMYA
ncbi:PDZ and LIM domain protein 7, partial [Dufourea novaeangliae]